MSQYRRLFFATRIPKIGKDALVLHDPQRHIILQRGANFYTLDVLDSEGNAIPQHVLEAQIQTILSEKLATGPGLGALTAMDRNSWADARESLSTVPSNAEALYSIDSAMFSVCLEHESPANAHVRFFFDTRLISRLVSRIGVTPACSMHTTKFKHFSYSHDPLLFRCFWLLRRIYHDVCFMETPRTAGLINLFNLS